MPDPSTLSRRRRQVLDVVFAQGEATVNQVVDALPDAPTAMAVRRMMHVLVEQGFLRTRQAGREVVYSPTRSKSRAGDSALQHVLDTFFDGEMEEALASYLTRKEAVSSEKLKRLRNLIDDARRTGS